MFTKMGFNKADLSGIDKMQPEEFMLWLDRTMTEGKNQSTPLPVALVSGLW